MTDEKHEPPLPYVREEYAAGRSAPRATLEVSGPPKTVERQIQVLLDTIAVKQDAIEALTRDRKAFQYLADNWGVKLRAAQQKLDRLDISMDAILELMVRLRRGDPAQTGEDAGTALIRELGAQLQKERARVAELEAELAKHQEE